MRRVGDEVPDHLPHARVRGRHCEARGERREARPCAEQHAVGGSEERGVQACAAECGELVRGDARVAGPDDAVDEPEGELEPVGIGDERREAAGRAAFGGRLVARGRGEPAARERNRLRDDIVEGHHASSSRRDRRLRSGSDDG